MDQEMHPGTGLAAGCKVNKTWLSISNHLQQYQLLLGEWHIYTLFILFIVLLNTDLLTLIQEPSESYTKGYYSTGVQIVSCTLSSDSVFSESTGLFNLVFCASQWNLYCQNNEPIRLGLSTDVRSGRTSFSLSTWWLQQAFWGPKLEYYLRYDIEMLFMFQNGINLTPKM